MTILFPGLLVEKWWKLLRYVQDLKEKKTLFKNATPFPFHSSSFDYSQLISLCVCDGVHQCFLAQELLKCIMKV